MAPSIVVVDDEPPIVDIVCDVLTDEGFKAIPCRHGREAVSCIQRHQPQLVILDVQMPEVDGIEVFQRLRASPLTENTPVLFFTANRHLVDRWLPNYRELGADLLPKPFNIERLVEAVERAIAPQH